MRIGVAVCTLGRDSLKTTLEALTLQPFDGMFIGKDMRGNLSRARNIAWRALAETCDVIAFTDDDCIPDADFIERGRKFFELNPKLALMQGKVYGGFETSETFMFVGANLWVRTSALIEVGGFDEEYLYAGGSEDVDIGWALLEKGRECKFNDLCRVLHPTQPQHQHLQRNSQRLAQKFPDRYAKLIISNDAT